MLKFTYSSFWPFSKNKERVQKFKGTGDPRYIYQKELDNDCFQHGTTYGDFKELPRRTTSYKFLHDKAFNIVKSPYMMDINADLFQRFIIFFFTWPDMVEWHFTFISISP